MLPPPCRLAAFRLRTVARKPPEPAAAAEEAAAAQSAQGAAPPLRGRSL